MKKLALILFAIFINIAAYSAFLKNVPVDLKQPDGSIIHCFVTGDEFHRRVHDKDNYTIVQNPLTGFYVYANKSGGELVPTENMVGKCDPSQLGVEPNLDIPFQKMEELRTDKLKSAKIITENSTKGDFNNIVIFIRFSDQSPTTLTLQDYEGLFNSTTTVSLKSYYKEVSNSQLNVTSHFFPQPQNQTILEYQDSHPRSYYTQFNETTNPLGYRPEEYIDREQTLFKKAVESVKDQIVASQINTDINNDGFIDNLIFILQGNVDTWGSILWPMSSGVNGSSIFIGNKQLNQFNKQLSTGLNVGVICHEFFHALGAPDLYRYTDKTIDPVGCWDLMAGGFNQHMTTFMKWKYGKWFDALPEIKQPGTYTLDAVSKSPFACYKIPSPNNPYEYFVVEYRKKEGLLETSIPENYGDGLIIYRINNRYLWGNAGGPPDEIYIYRVGGTTTINGDISKAAFSANAGRTIFNGSTSPFCFLSTGEKGWIDISNISTTGTQISFTVNESIPLSGPQNLSARLLDNQIQLKWNSPIKKSAGFLGYNVYFEDKINPINNIPLQDTTYITPIPGQKATYFFKVTAKYQQEESDPSICSFVNFATPSVKDSLTLVAIYNQCNGPNWTRKTNWLTGPLNKWEGVEVENGRVVKLSLGDERPSVGLTGQLPSDLILNLTEIRWLSFWQNRLTGNIPESWSSLVHLEVLSLSMNNLTGTLPPSWSALVNLKRLEVLGNQITGTLPESWSALVNLEHLWLKENQLTGTLPESWSSLVKLQDLWLNLNKLTGTIPKSWSTFKKMRNLSLNGNQLTGPLPESWSNFTEMWQLELNENQFTGNLPEGWSAFTKMRFLNINNNKISGPVPESWSSMVNLEYIYMGDNQITSLPKMSSWTKLQLMTVGNNLLDFADIEPNMYLTSNKFWYTPQQKFGKAEIYNKNQGQQVTLSVTVGGTNNLYQWFKDYSQLVGETSSSLVFDKLSIFDSGTYFCRVTNTNVPNLTLESEPFQVQVILSNNAPIANAGTDQSTNEGTTISLDGSLSSDPDGTPLTYKWNAPSGISLSSTSAPKPTFKVPEVKKDSTLIFSLIVNDGFVDSQPSLVRVNVLNVIKVGVNDFLKSKLMIYPNPTTGVIKIEGLSTTHKNEITILSIDGNLIRKKSYDLPTETIDISDQASGTYLLDINGQSFKIQKK